jgi:quercetin dioxygenase-like cupin family protein
VGTRARQFLLVLLVCAGCATLDWQKEGSKVMVVTAFEDAKFIPIVPNESDSPEIAVLWGEPTTGPSAMFIRAKNGFATPMHIHSSDYHLVVLQGSMKHWHADQTEADAKPLGPGSYWFQPGGHAHADSCLSDECLVHIVWAGKRDGRLAEPRK